jgi:hypothetical protein
MMNDRVQSCRAARRRCQYAFGKTLREDLAAAQNCIAAEPMGDNQELDGPPCERKVGYTASIAAMDTSRNRSAGRTETDTSRHPDRDDSLITLVAPLSTTNPRGTRLERWSACCMALILPPIKTPDISQTASKVSQSQNCRPNDTVEALKAAIMTTNLARQIGRVMDACQATPVSA